MCLCRCVLNGVCMCAGQRSKFECLHLFPCSLFFWNNGSHWTYGWPFLARLAGQWVSGTHLSLLPSYGCVLPYSVFTWVLGTWILKLVQQVLYPLSLLPIPKCILVMISWKHAGDMGCTKRLTINPFAPSSVPLSRLLGVTSPGRFPGSCSAFITHTWVTCHRLKEEGLRLVHQLHHLYEHEKLFNPFSLVSMSKMVKHRVYFLWLCLKIK